MTSSTMRNMLALLGLAICATILLFTLKWGIADQFAFEAKHLENAWRREGEVNQAKLVEALNLMENALSLAPNNPDYLDQTARLNLLKFYFTVQSHDADTARAQLLRSREIRPEFARNWATYLDLKYALNEADDDLSEAIVMTMNAGPWEPLSIQAVTRTGVGYFNSLDEAAQGNVLIAIENGLNSPVAGIPKRTKDLTIEHTKGWTLEFTNRLLEMLAMKPWNRKSTSAKLELTLTLWSLANAEQKKSLSIKVASAIIEGDKRALLNTVRARGRLSEICPVLPRTEPYESYCRAIY